ncbi:MAG: hypothetical protein ACOYBP_01550 [Microbacteriaceae bacterium]
MAASASDEVPEYSVLAARDDDDFTKQLRDLSGEIRAGSFVVATGPISSELARDAIAAVTSLDAHVVWIAPRHDSEILLGLSTPGNDELLEQAFLAVEHAYPELLDPRLTVTSAPIVDVVFVASQAN